MTQANSAVALDSELPEIEDFDRRIRAAAQRQRWLSLAVYGFVVVCATAWFGFTVVQIKQAKGELAGVTQKQTEVEKRLETSQRELSERTQSLAKQREQLGQLETQLTELSRARANVLDFMSRITTKENLLFLDPDVDWGKTRETILKMKPGPRQTALLSALLVSWKKTPFVNGGVSLETGIDSPRFAILILESVGVPNLPSGGPWREGDGRLSDELEKRFPNHTSTPEPGDLMLILISQQSGRFVTFYLGNQACIGNDGSRPGFRIFQCEKYIRERGWTDHAIEYRRVDYP